MNFDYRIQQAEEQVKTAVDAVAIVKADLIAAREFTAKLLDVCAEDGLTKVAIGTTHKSIPQSVSWGDWAKGSLFGIGPISKGGGRKNGWPAIWGVAEKLGIYGGCGNHMQVQADTSRLIDGVYHLRGGKWYKIDGSNQ